MKRSTFLLIAAIITTLFGGMMLFLPIKAAESFGLTPNPESSLIFRWLGAIILSSAILNFLVRNHGDTDTLKAVFIFNIALHAITLIVDFVGIGEGILEVSKLVPGLVFHSFICIGSIVYLMRIKPSDN